MRRHLSNSCPSLSNCSSSWMFRSIATYTPSHLLQNVSSATYSSYSCSYIFSTPPSTPSQFRYFTSIPTEEEDNRTVRQKCDPYGQDGKPLSTEKTQELLDMLAPTWTYDESKKTISRKYRFQLVKPCSPLSLSSSFSMLSSLYLLHRYIYIYILIYLFQY